MSSANQLQVIPSLNCLKGTSLVFELPNLSLLAGSAAWPCFILASLTTTVWPQLNPHSCIECDGFQGNFVSITSFDLQTFCERSQKFPNPHFIVRKTRLRCIIFGRGHIARKWPNYKIVLSSCHTVVTSIPRWGEGSELESERRLEVRGGNWWLSEQSFLTVILLSILVILPASCGASAGPRVSNSSQEW